MSFSQRLEEMEEKLKQSEFKQYITQNNLPSQYETQAQQGERPYSANKNLYRDLGTVDLDPVFEMKKPKIYPSSSQNKLPNRAFNALEVNYYGDKTQNMKNIDNKKGPFNIVKKRKLYNDKNFNDF